MSRRRLHQLKCLVKLVFVPTTKAVQPGTGGMKAECLLLKMSTLISSDAYVKLDQRKSHS